MNRVAAILIVLMAGCGGHAMRIVDAAVADTGAGVDTGEVGAGPVDATPEVEAGPSSCADLQTSAQASFEVLIASNRACASDVDCTIISASGRCLNGCSYYAVAGAAASDVTAAGKQLCVAFDQQGCQPSGMMCPPPPQALCDAGRCTVVAP